MVAKPLRSMHKPGDRRSWLKVKNRGYWKYNSSAKPPSKDPLTAPHDGRSPGIMSCGRVASAGDPNTRIVPGGVPVAVCAGVRALSGQVGIALHEDHEQLVFFTPA
jgi:hypothetical protein